MKQTASKPASNVGAENLERVLDQLSLFPFVLVSWLVGQKPQPYLAKMTGLSQSHLRRGTKLRESTQQRAVETFERKVIQNATKQGWTEAEVVGHIQTMPSEVACEPRPYANFFYGLQASGEDNLTRTVAFAEEVDKLLINLYAALKNDDREAFKRIILECNWVGEVFGSINDSQEENQYLIAFREVSDWGSILNAFDILFLEILHCLFAALDAEWGLIYFKDFQSRPLFLLVMPKQNSGKSTDRNFLYMPVRRLLELSHALIVKKRDSHWPKKPVGRKELGEVLERSDQEVGNLFDGTKKLDAQLFSACWELMCKKIAHYGDDEQCLR